MAGDGKTGVCIMRMEAGLDTGTLFDFLNAWAFNGGVWGRLPGVADQRTTPGFIDSGSAPPEELVGMTKRIPAGYIGTVDDTVATRPGRMKLWLSRYFPIRVVPVWSKATAASARCE